MPRETVVRRESSGFVGPCDSWGPLLLVVLASLVIRCLQLLALKLASGSQAASGPVLTDGDPLDYFVYLPSPASPALGPVLGNWDGQWYMRIATIGYPHADEVQSATDAFASAFPPGFPLLARATMGITGLPFVWAALIVNTALTLGAAVVLYQLIRWAGLSTRAAVAAGIGLSLLPAAPILVTAYSEALALFLVILALRLLLSHHYLWMSLAVLALGLTRPVALAFAPVVLFHAAQRWHAGRQAVRSEEWGGMAVAVITAVVSPWVWPWIAVRLYGVPDTTQFVGSERTSRIVSGLGSGYLPNALAGSGGGGLILVLVAGLLLVGIPTLLGLRIGWPVELIAWGVAYTAMVITVTRPAPSFLRYLMLAAPLFVVVFAALVVRPKPAKTVLLILLVAAGLWSQWGWITNLFIYDGSPSFPP